MEDFNYGQRKLDELAEKVGMKPGERRPGENREQRRRREQIERRLAKEDQKLKAEITNLQQK